MKLLSTLTIGDVTGIIATATLRVLILGETTVQLR